MKKPAIIGVITEIKDNENRVGLTPEGVAELTKSGHRVFVQRHAGKGAGYHDHDYVEAGADIKITPEEVVSASDILVKVKEPIEKEYHLLELLAGKTLYTYLHLSGVAKSLTEKLLEHNITGIAYETVEDEEGRLPLLTPMSEIAGVLSVQYGAEYLQKKYGGRGRTLGSITGVKKANVVVYGAGIVGKAAAKTAAGMGSNVTLFDINDGALERAKSELGEYLGAHLIENVEFLKPEREEVNERLVDTDLLVGAVLVPGAHAPQVVSQEEIHLMKDGAVIVDVSVDQGGCIWGTKATTHSKPIYKIENKVYCCVANMPGQVSRQSTQALTSVTLPYLLRLANDGVLESLKSDAGFLKGLNTYQGNITYETVAKDLKMEDKFVEAMKAIG